ncbi:MAG: DUF927 domain-containing protein [Bradyrhizobium sp.]|uniref:DUF927 domain-containing protein n=1 Tax=Bradyrhizobium sp. TaxID=376 RepID=UPI003D0DDD08
MADFVIELAKDGVYRRNGFARRHKVAGAIKLAAVVKSALDGKEFAEIKFTSWDGLRKFAHLEMAALNSRNHHQVIDKLTNDGYRWPTDPKAAKAVVAELARTTPKRIYTLVGSYGWHGPTFLTSYGQYPVSAHNKLRIDEQTAARRAPYLLGPGSLDQWKSTVGRTARNSSILRLCIAAGFAAPLLKPLNIESFGLNLHGPTSQGKTSVLYGGASVAGLIDGHIPTWADSIAAHEQFFVGYRDCLAPLDETGDGTGREVSIDEKIGMLSFGVARNHIRNLSTAHEKKLRIITRDYRIILVSTSEYALRELALGNGRSRVPGEELRLIDVPVDGGKWGVFENVPSNYASVEPALAGKQFADLLKQDAEQNQGHALKRFLERLVNDPNAIETVKNVSMAKFISDAKGGATNRHLRVKEKFALLYAAGALAIGYEIVPWKEKALFSDIEQQWLAASAFLEKPAVRSPAQPVSNAAALCTQIRDAVTALAPMKIQQDARSGACDPERRASAKAFQVGGKVYVKPTAWPTICEHNKHLLRSRKVLLTESRRDTLTMAKKVPGIEGKRRYYVLDAAALEALAGGSRQS